MKKLILILFIFICSCISLGTEGKYLPVDNKKIKTIYNPSGITEKNFDITHAFIDHEDFNKYNYLDFAMIDFSDNSQDFGGGFGMWILPIPFIPQFDKKLEENNDIIGIAIAKSYNYSLLALKDLQFFIKKDGILYEAISKVDSEYCEYENLKKNIYSNVSRCIVYKFSLAIKDLGQEFSLIIKYKDFETEIPFIYKKKFNLWIFP